MKNVLKFAFLALPFLALPSSASAQGSCCTPPCKVDAGFNWWFRVNSFGCGCQAGPWYSYYPYDAYFQAPAPTGCYPFWPTAAASAGMPAPAGAVPPAAAPAVPGVQPTGYTNVAPPYWYGR